MSGPAWRDEAIDTGGPPFAGWLVGLAGLLALGVALKLVGGSLGPIPAGTRADPGATGSTSRAGAAGGR